jgi:hypothetical protein
VGEFYTTTTNIQLPPGILTDGANYFFRISASSEPGVDYSTAPFRHGLPHAIAQALSGVVTP